MINSNLLPTKAYCINLKDRPGRFETILKNWEGKMPIERFDAVDMRKQNDGMQGVYLSHLEIMRSYLEKDEYAQGIPLLIIEDDSVPCSDFKERLEIVWPMLPNDWDIFLPGFWPNQFSVFSPQHRFIHKAEKEVIGNHCWCIKAASLLNVIEFFDKHHNRHLDDVMRHLQLHFSMYISIPSFAHQDGAWSDTSNQPTYTDPTRKYFKDKL